MCKIIYYYQTFSTLSPLVLASLKNVNVYVSSLHFGKSDGVPYLRLNDAAPETFKDLWPDLEAASKSGIRVMAMLGGAGMGIGPIFNDFPTYYALLWMFLTKYPMIQGIDLDVEENVTLPNILRLIQQLRDDFGAQFTITMAPTSGAIVGDGPGLGGFSYKALIDSQAGRYVNWFNVQCYGCFTEDTYQSMVGNGYRPDQLVMTMRGGEYSPDTLPTAVTAIDKLRAIYPSMAGCALWEYGDTGVPPVLWGQKIGSI